MRDFDLLSKIKAMIVFVFAAEVINLSREQDASGYATKRGYDASKGFVRSENCRENIVLTTGKGDIQKASGKIVFYRAKA